MEEKNTAQISRRRVAAAVRRLRNAVGMTQEQAASRVGMGWRHLQKIEAAEVNVTLATIARLADLFGVDPSVFLLPDTEQHDGKDRSGPA